MNAKLSAEPHLSLRYRALLQLLRTADTIWNASRLYFARWDLGPSQFNVLNLLHGAPDGLSQSELSRELIMHRSNVTGLVDRLEARGLLQRKEEKADRRAYRVVLTPAGERLMREILPGYHSGAEQILGSLSEKRVREIMADLQHAAEQARSVATNHPPL